MAMTFAGTVKARAFVDPQGRIVESAGLLADEVLRQLPMVEVITIDFSDMRGLSSSYFNFLLQRVIAVITVAELNRRLVMAFDSPAQQQVYQRSLGFASRTVA
jgi:hypothetical protein